MSDSIKVELDKYVKFISSLSGVLQIYLFGSYAYGEPRRTSDIDLMVITENNLDPFKTAYKIRRGLTDTDLALDIAVNRKSAFEEASENSLFQKSIKENGVLLYVA
jgi:predicted nucleotidyltransferase